MKKLVFCVLIATLCIYNNFAKANESAVVKGKIDDPFTKIQYTTTIGEGYFPGLFLPIHVDHEGNFKFEINPESIPSILTLTVGENQYAVILELGREYNFDIRFTENEYQFNYSGPYAEGHDYYNSLTVHPSIHLSPLYKSLRNTDMETITAEIDVKKEEEVNQFDLLLDQKYISNDFYKSIIIDREIYYTTLTAALAQSQFIALTRNSDKTFKDLNSDIQTLWRNLLDDLSLSEKELLQSRWWYEYISHYLDYKDFSQEDYSQEKHFRLKQDNRFHTYRLGFADKHLDGNILKLYTAQYLHATSSEQKNEKELIQLAADFQIKYPQNPYKVLFQQYIDPIIAYYTTANNSGASYQIIEDYDLVNSLKDAVALAGGKPVYLDVWATWCVPCIQEFKHKPVVSKLLREFGYNPIYISIDMEQHEDKWRKMIAQYNLEDGIHIRANGNLKSELMKLYGSQNSLTIPIYAILDEYGEIKVKTAARPSDAERLRMQLTNNQ